jgi:hypothetical protein
MRSKIASLKKSLMSEVSAMEAGQAVKHLIDIVKQIRSECAAMATYVVEIHAIDLRSLFLALHKVEECGIDRPIPKPVCDEVGLPARKKAFTQGELEKLVQWNND